MNEHKQIIIICGAVELQIINGHLHFAFIRMVIVGWLAAADTSVAQLRIITTMKHEISLLQNT